MPLSQKWLFEIPFQLAVCISNIHWHARPHFWYWPGWCNKNVEEEPTRDRIDLSINWIHGKWKENHSVYQGLGIIQQCIMIAKQSQNPASQMLFFLLLDIPCCGSISLWFNLSLSLSLSLSAPHVHIHAWIHAFWMTITRKIPWHMLWEGRVGVDCPCCCCCKCLTGVVAGCCS